MYQYYNVATSEEAGHGLRATKTIFTKATPI